MLLGFSITNNIIGGTNSALKKSTNGGPTNGGPTNWENFHSSLNSL